MRKKLERQRVLKIYGAFYQMHYSELGGCFYCGSGADTIDHCPPISWVESRTVKGWNAAGIPLVLLKSCWDCNNRLANRPFFTAAERLKFLENSLEGEYERKASLWSEGELQEMSPMFQKMIRGRKSLLVDLHARVREVQRRRARTDTHPEEP